MTKLLFQSLREIPAEADTVSHQLLLRGAFIRPLGAGIFDYLPLGRRVTHKIEKILREEMDALGAQEVNLPVVQPARIWQQSGRWQSVGDELARFTDRAERELCLAMTHEEVVAELASQMVKSYRQLPLLLYQIQTKFRDEPRPHGGLIRTREFSMKDAYSLHPSEADIDTFYPKMQAAYERIFERCGLEVISVEGDSGMMGGRGAHAFMAPTPIGEDILLVCDESGYRANRQVARFQKPQLEAEDPAPLEEVHTPGVSTIEALAKYLHVPASRTAKALFYMAEITGEMRFVFAVVRGDMALSESKLAQVSGAARLRPATPEEIRAIGAEPGYGSPLGIDRDGVTVVVDELIPHSPNLVAGANREGYHVCNLNYGRDFDADLVADIVAAQANDPCPHCGKPMRAQRGIEVGNSFKLGSRYSEALGASFLDPEGVARPIVMGSYGIGVGRLMAAVVEQRHDEHGILWPSSIAPYQLALIALGAARNPAVARASDKIYQELTGAGLEVLYDDRDQRPGVKFNDADLIGIPLRVTAGSKSLARDMVELKVRGSQERDEVSLAALTKAVQARVQPAS